MHRARKPPLPIDSSLIDSLMCAAAFDHPVNRLERLETHISWLILTGDFVYKIKKPVVFDFLDFGDLEKRKFYCDEEIRLNKPWAPDLYLDVVPITLDAGQPRFDGSGETIEYAVRMRRFDQRMRLDRQLELDELSATDMQELAANIAARHENAVRAGLDQRDRVITLTKEFMWDNFAALEGFIDSPMLDSLKGWTDRELRESESLLSQRFDDGFVRDCHGDLHLANLVRLPGGITTFDCIEFNADFRQIDVMCDIAFLTMDLVERKRHDLAAHFLNRYLEVTGDYEAVAVFSLYFVYRCLVRAKVAVIRSREREDASDSDSDIDEARAYCEMAGRQIAIRTPVLVIMCGLSGSGKTFVAGQLMAALPAIRVRSDLERKRMFALGEKAESGSDVGGGIYTDQVSVSVYERLFGMARVVLNAGHSTILDATFLHHADRASAISVARDCGCSAVTVLVTASNEVMQRRITERQSQSTDASEATIEVLERQLATAEPFTDMEHARLITCDNSEKVDLDLLVKQIRNIE